MSRYRWFLLGICVAALVPRVLSVTWNDFAHSDVIGDAAAAASLQRESRLLVSDNPDVSSVPHFFPVGIGRNLLVAHPPLWPILGAGFSVVSGFPATDQHAFFALRLLSLLFGMGVILLAATLAKRLFGEKEALWIAAFIGMSYLMIDYSGNGSFYALQAVLYLVWVFIAYANLSRKALLLGLVSGIAYMVNQQAMILAAASFIVLCLDAKRSPSQKVADLISVTAVTFVICLPWFVRNFLLYGDPLFSHAVNATYVYTKARLLTEVRDGRMYYVTDFPAKMVLLRSILLTWLPNNLYYMARKLFILAPVLFFFFSFAWIDYVFSSKRLKTMFPALLLLTLHIVLSASWPITKFRYFVPMFPLVLIIAMDQLRHTRFGARGMSVLCSLTALVMLAFSYLTYVSVPTHTYYYDGAITQDPFHGRGEYEYLKDIGHLSLP